MKLMARLAAFGLLILSFVGLSTPPTSAQTGRSFQLTYEVELQPLPSDAKELKVWIPLAMSDRYQEIRRRDIQAPAPYQVTQDPEYGNDILFLNLRQPLPAAVQILIQYEADVRGNQIELAKAANRPTGSLPKMDLYLKPTRYMVIDDQIRSLSQAITVGAATSMEKAQRIYRYVIERMRYDKETPGWGNGDTLRACQVGAGNCTDFHSLFISLARASGIPAQFQIGLPVPEKPEGEIPGYHCWAEFFIPEVGWVPVDASEAWKDQKRYEEFFGTYDPNRLAFSQGRDIQLIPKPSNGPINIFFFPYAEIDGRAVEGERVKTKFRFRDIHLVQTRQQQGGLS
jgi:transglutaminase-like putative cysteine protease